MSKATPERGRFRSFLLVSLNHFLFDAHDRASALKSGGANAPVSLDGIAAQDRYAAEPVDAMLPNKLFERRWATTLLAQVYTFIDSHPVCADQSGFHMGIQKQGAPGDGWVCLPGEQHNRGCNAAFSDGHADHWRWRWSCLAFS